MQTFPVHVAGALQAATHAPLSADEQHPPLQGCCPSQDVVHWLFRHAIVGGQSVGVFGPPQPQVGIVAMTTHLSPVVAAVQSTHSVPAAPHAVSLVVVHVPPPQHVALPHVPSPALPHAPVHPPLAPHVGVAPPQAWHIAPVWPQAPLPVPT
jgi:hypothetical protein